MRQIGLIALLLAASCSRGSHEPEADPSGGRTTLASAAGFGAPLPENVEFVLGPEFAGACEEKAVIDVNLGHEPEVFVRAAHCQVTGQEPAPELVNAWSERLRTLAWVRRVDVVRSLCAQASRGCSLHYSDPWQEQVHLSARCERRGTRDLGAVLMYWNDCPGGVNCGMDWANTHASGMDSPHALHGTDALSAGFYSPQNPGFWRRELLDARWAGLQFLLLNTFGPDLARLPALVEALREFDGGIQVALFDDTWGWGKGGAPWNSLPDFNNTEAAAELIYQKWKQFYSAVPSQHWYRYAGRPLISFYNAGTLKPARNSAATLTRLKALFQADFGVEPFLAVDRAFFEDPATPTVADSEFLWNTFQSGRLSQSQLKGVDFSHFMPKWDAVGREDNGRLAAEGDLIVKGPELLGQHLEASANSDVAVIATWNDLGEGTGIARNYDYYYRGKWLPPHAFMKMLRASQCH